MRGEASKRMPPSRRVPENESHLDRAIATRATEMPRPERSTRMPHQGLETYTVFSVEGD